MNPLPSRLAASSCAMPQFPHRYPQLGIDTPQKLLFHPFSSQQHQPHSQTYTPVNGWRDPQPGVPQAGRTGSPACRLPTVWDWGLRYSRHQRAQFRNPVGAAGTVGPPDAADPQTPSRVSRGLALAGGLHCWEGSQASRLCCMRPTCLLTCSIWGVLHVKSLPGAVCPPKIVPHH